MLSKRQIIWRYTYFTGEYPACHPIPLNNGLFIPTDQSLYTVQSAVFQPDCYQDSPMLSVSKELSFEYLPLFFSTWQDYIDSTYGTFRYSIFPVIFSITSSAVITWFLTLVVYTNHTSKPSLILKMSTLFASIYLIMIFVKSIELLNQQQKYGRLSGFSLLAYVSGNNAFNAIDFLAVLLLQINQVQIIMRLFSRRNEKRVAFFFGISISIAAQAIWGVSSFANFDSDDDENISIMPAFIYLLRIAMSVMYSALVGIYTVTKWSYILNKSVLLLTILNIFVVNVSIGFFIADVANLWVSELSDIFNVTTYVVATVIPWEWVNKIQHLERLKEKEGILGRRFYEDEMNKIDRYGLFVEVNSDTLDGSGSSANLFTLEDSESKIAKQNLPSNVKVADSESMFLDNKAMKSMDSVYKEENGNVFETGFKGIKSKIHTTTNTLLELTDKIIAISLAVPRSVSSTSRELYEIRNANEGGKKKEGGSLPRSRAPRKDVFLYSRKEVTFCDDGESM